MLEKIDAIPAGTKSFELFVPKEVTVKGEVWRQDAAMAVLLDRLIGKGLFPAGFTERPNGRLYKYSDQPPKSATP